MGLRESRGEKACGGASLEDRSTPTPLPLASPDLREQRFRDVVEPVLFTPRHRLDVLFREFQYPERRSPSRNVMVFDGRLYRIAR
ncbi:hypothetical protein Q1695_012800 [Nippostrongylus brasiliensis]|nr:hypothetical protein Q1695_012800 [Nippostrongylus brasiliensis]